MLDNFFEAYYNQKGKKGYEVLGLKLTLLFIMIVVAGISRGLGAL